MTDEALRAAYAELMNETHRPGREGCPPVDELVAVVDQKGDEDSRLVVLDHVMSCLNCRRDFEILRAVDAGAPRPVRRTFPIALAASILLVLAGGFLWNNWRRDNEATRSGGPAVVLVSPVGETSPQTTLNLIWRPVPGAGLYTAEILREDATLAWSAGTRETMVTVPDSVRLDPGQVYGWWVRAQLVDGTEARSEVRRFQLKNR